MYARRVSIDLAPDEFDHPLWDQAHAVTLKHYWTGKEAPEGRHAEARLLWSEVALHVRFQCRQTEPLVVARNPQTNSKTVGLWDRDVCEIFLAPGPMISTDYFEFEAAPTGEWIDLAISHASGDRETDFAFNSGITTAGRILEDEVLVAMRIPWQGALIRPEPQHYWRANLYRCVGSGDNRGYIVWRPTFAEKPDFHVAEAFGELHFE